MTEPAPKPPADRHLWEFRAVRDAAAIAAVAGLAVLGAYLEVVTVPLLAALLLAYLVEPLVRRLAALRWGSRGRALAAVVASLGLAAVAIVALVAPPVVRQGVELAGNADRYLATARGWVASPERPAWLRERIEPLADLLPAPSASAAAQAEPAPPASAAAVLDEERVRAIVRAELAQRPGTAGAGLDRGLGQAGWETLRLLAGLFGGVVGLGIFAIVLVFAFVAFSLHFPAIIAFAASLVPPARRARVGELAQRMDGVVAAFVRGRLLVAACVGGLYALGWSLVGVPYGLALGLAVGALSIVPYLAAIGLPLAWGLVLVDALGRTPADPGWYAVAAGSEVAVVWWKVLLLPWMVNAVVQGLEDYLLNPLIQGQATRLHPLAIMVSVIAGGALAGIYGMLLAVPLAACLRILLEEVLLPRLRGGGPPP